MERDDADYKDDEENEEGKDSLHQKRELEMDVESLTDKNQSEVPVRKKVSIHQNPPPVLYSELHLKFALSVFLVNNNLPFNLSSKLLTFLQDLLGSYDIGLLSRTKIDEHEVSQIARDGIAYEISENLRSKLEDSPFSICVDEGRDKSKKEFLAIGARFLALIWLVLTKSIYWFDPN